MKRLHKLFTRRGPTIDPHTIENGIRRDRTKAYIRAIAELNSQYGNRDLTEDERERIISRFEEALGGRHNALTMLEDLKMGTSRTLQKL